MQPCSIFGKLVFTSLLCVIPAFAQTQTQTPTETPEAATPAPAAPAKEVADPAKLRQVEFDKGSKLFQEKKYTQALTHYSKAAQSPAEDGESTIMEGYCYFNLKQYDQALKKYQQAAESGKLVSIRNRAQKLAQTLNSYMRGICPGNCLKPSMPGWRKMSVPGTPDRLVWMVYPYLDPAGKGGSEYWSNDHMGEVIEYVNGRPINKGRCPICNGTGKVSLPR